MPDLVINTGPLIALTAAADSLGFLQRLYGEILVPLEVIAELQIGGDDCPELRAIRKYPVFHCISKPANPPILLHSQLDLGEASVIQSALLHKVSTVAIDEKLGRRMARLHELRVTGSIGILVKASKARLIPDLNDCFNRMREKGVWISETLQEQALHAARSN